MSESTAILPQLAERYGPTPRAALEAPLAKADYLVGDCTAADVFVDALGLGQNLGLQQQHPASVVACQDRLQARPALRPPKQARRWAATRSPTP